MTPDQLPAFLKQVSLADPRLLPGDKAEAMAMAALWSVALADVDLEFALNAVGRHYAKSPFQVKPADVADQWRNHVKDRAQRYVDPVPTADPDDPIAYNAELLATRQAAVQTGHIPRPRTAIGPGAPEIAALAYEEEDLSAMRLEGDLKRMWEGVGGQAHAENKRRRGLVLAYEDLAERLAKAPINIRPDCWTGFVPQELGAGGLNRSPIRRALAELVAEAERRAA